MLYALRKTYRANVGRLVVTAMAILSLLAVTFVDCLSHGAHSIAHDPINDHSHGLQLAVAIADFENHTNTHLPNGLEPISAQAELACDGMSNTNTDPAHPSDPDPAHADCACCSIAHCFSCLVPADGGVVIAWARTQRPAVRPTAALSSPLWRLERPPKTTA